MFCELATTSVSGVKLRRGTELLKKKEDSDPKWSATIDDFRHLKAHELYEGFVDGYTYTVPVIEMPTYLPYLLRRFLAAGGLVERRTISSLAEATSSHGLVVNCTGLGAADLVNNSGLYPIRGRIVRVQNPGLEHFIAHHEPPDIPTYVVPRSDDVVLGGTWEENEWDLPEHDPDVTQQIMRRCLQLEPRLANAKVLQEKVGLRPGRGEIRLEPEVLSSDFDDNLSGPKAEERLAQSLKDFAKTKGVIGFYFLDHFRVPTWRQHLRQSGIKQWVCESEIVAYPPLPSFDD